MFEEKRSRARRNNANANRVEGEGDHERPIIIKVAKDPEPR